MSACHACRRGTTATLPPLCPECGEELRGGWARSEPHWRARHAQVLPYAALVAGLCAAHRFGAQAAAAADPPSAAEAALRLELGTRLRELEALQDQLDDLDGTEGRDAGAARKRLEKKLEVLRAECAALLARAEAAVGAGLPPGVRKR